MPRYFLGADVGATKTHVLIADETGQAIGLGRSGPGNHETVGYAGLSEALCAAANQALAMAGLSVDQIAGAGFGVAGYDWPSEREPTLRAIGALGLTAPIDAVNDTLIGLLAGSSEGWGVAVVSGTGCNCWGWDRTRRRIGQVTGSGQWMGEAAGGTELIAKAVQVIAHEWTRRGPATQLTPAFVRYTGTLSAADLLEGLVENRLRLDASAAPLVFEVAAQGDAVAHDLIRWAGCELGQLAVGVIRQLEFEALDFEVVLVGSLYDGSPLLIEAMQQAVHAVAPAARFVRLDTPPVAGAVLLGMEQVMTDAASLRLPLMASTKQLLRELN